MKRKFTGILGAVATAFLNAQDQVLGLIPAANTYDAAVAVHESAITRTNDVAVTDRHLLWKQGGTDGAVDLCGVADDAIGTIDNVEADTDMRQSILLLGKGKTKKMVASEAIAAGVDVFQAADGKVSPLPAAAGTYKCVGSSLTAAGADEDVLEVNDCKPFPVTVA